MLLFAGSQTSILRHLVFLNLLYRVHLKEAPECFHLQVFLRVVVAVERKAHQVLEEPVRGPRRVVERMGLMALHLLVQLLQMVV